MVVAAGPEIKNFDQLKVGDRVEATYIQAFAIGVALAAKK